jgi:hypothetical protein
MRRLFVDLLIGNVVMLDPGGMIHEHIGVTVGARVANMHQFERNGCSSF